MSIPKYKLVVNAKDGENGIEITEGKYEGVIYTYGEVQFLPGPFMGRGDGDRRR